MDRRCFGFDFVASFVSFHFFLVFIFFFFSPPTSLKLSGWDPGLEFVFVVALCFFLSLLYTNIFVGVIYTRSHTHTHYTISFVSQDLRRLLGLLRLFLPPTTVAPTVALALGV